ncbi:MAG: sigma-54 dependent transcriptional regulator [Candidatus Muiribacteriota bacterium]
MNEKILILDDEELILYSLEKMLKKDFEVETASSLKEFREKITKFNPEILILDIRLKDGSSVEMIKKDNIIDDDMVVILMSAYSEEQFGAEALKINNSMFIQKPVSNTVLLKNLSELIKQKNLQRINKLLTKKYGTELIYKSQSMVKVYEDAIKYAKTSEPVLITGETGSGKQVMANFIHEQSNRKNNTFLDVNCAAISETLLESQLFGHKKGAFTDAKSDFKGFFELTDTGTLFLDEISEMKPELQAKLLKVVENNEVLPLGANKSKKIDVRIITATNRELSEYINEGKFRKDLFYRLNVFNITIPPLRKRKEDIEPLVNHFIEKANKKLHKNIEEVSKEVLRRYIDYSWPGNVRELKNVIYRAVLLSNDSVLTKDGLSVNETQSFSADYDIPEDGIKLDKIVGEIETRYILKALEKTGGSQSAAAKLLGITRDMLRYRIKNYILKNIE